MVGVKVLDQAHGDGWTIYNSDCVEVLRGLPENSIHYTIYSPPFASLYTFSDAERDMSNNKDDAVFWTHFKFMIAENFRVTKPGRLVSIHCMNLPTSKMRDGFIGIRDFRGDIIRAHQDAGFIYHSEVCIRKDPVAAMQRTKALGLLHKQVKKDSTMSRMAIADYIVTMRKPGDNSEPVAGEFDAYHGTDTADGKSWPDAVALWVEDNWNGRRVVRPGDDYYSIAVWQRYAEPVWLDIAQGDVLSRKDARDDEDEAHIAPLQLTVIRRCIDTWTNPGDVVLSPFAGIGSEGYVAREMGRRFVGAELKPSYWRQAVKNLENVACQIGFDLVAAQ